MLAGGLGSALATVLGSLLVLAATFVYARLIRQISVRRAAATLEPGTAPAGNFGLPEALLATGLILFLLISVTTSFERRIPS